jgi:outer membrane immunogenic protein
MKKQLFGLVFAAAVLSPAISFAADLEPPPPVDDLRPASYDWTGPYVGIFGTAVGIDGSFDGVCGGGCGGATYNNIEHSGIGYGGGFLAGVNYQVDNFVLGVEGDWAFGGNMAANVEPGINTEINFDNMATLRARAGLAEGNTLFYVTGGAAAVDAEFGAVMASTESDNDWIWGWTVGGGIEHAFTDNFHVRLEYLFVGLEDGDFSLTDSASTTLTATQEFNDIHMVRAGLTYNFSW